MCQERKSKELRNVLPSCQFLVGIEDQLRVLGAVKQDMQQNGAGLRSTSS